MNSIELVNYEIGNFSNVTIGSKPIIKLVMLRLENFISYYLRGPGGIDLKNKEKDISAYCREVLYIEQSDKDKIKNWVIYYDEEESILILRACFWDKKRDRDLIMSDESLRDEVRTFGISNEIPHICNKTYIIEDNELISSFLSSITEFDTIINSNRINSLFSKSCYGISEYKVSRSFDIAERLEIIVDNLQELLYSHITLIIKNIENVISDINTKSIYDMDIDFQLSPVDMLKNTYGLKTDN